MENGVSKSILAIRMKMGFKSTIEFFKFLKSNSDLECNYSYYAKIEAGSVIPTSHIINSIGSALHSEDRSTLILSYCEHLFPKDKSLFVKNFTQQQKNKKAEKLSKTNGRTKVKELSLKQISSLSLSEAHYHYFLLITLSRRSLSIEEISGSLDIDQTVCRKITGDLVNARIVSQGEAVTSICSDLVFPDHYSSSGLRETYKKFDEWDNSFIKKMDFEELEKKYFIRRISPRFLNLIHSHCLLLFDLIRTSDDVDTVHNEEVISLSLKLMNGKVIG